MVKLSVISNSILKLCDKWNRTNVFNFSGIFSTSQAFFTTGLIVCLQAVSSVSRLVMPTKLDGPSVPSKFFVSTNYKHSFSSSEVDDWLCLLISLTARFFSHVFKAQIKHELFNNMSVLFTKINTRHPLYASFHMWLSVTLLSDVFDLVFD